MLSETVDPGEVKTSQFRVLYYVFLTRVIDLEVLSVENDTSKLLGQIAAALMGISILYIAPLIAIGGAGPGFTLTMQHLLIVTTMTVVGMFSVLSWDSTFPDKRDVLVLGPLPVRTITLFGAKLSASLHVLGISVLAVNIFTGILWPAVFASQHGLLGTLRSYMSYWFVMIVAALFIFCAVLGVQWIAGQVLPRQLFLRMSAALQLGVLCVVVALFFLEPSFESKKALTAAENQWLLRCLPSYWFLGMLQQLKGQMDPAFGMLARLGWWGSAISVVGGGSAVLLSYTKTLREMIEQPDITPGAWRKTGSKQVRGGMQRAITMFTARTLIRSKQHRLLLTFYLGGGFAMVMLYMKTLGRIGHTEGIEVSMMTASILVLSFITLGMRVVFAVPILVRANWIFRVTEGEAKSYLGLVRWTLYLLAFAPMMIASSVWFFAAAPAWLAAKHLVVLLLVGAIVCELCLYGFAKIPFTCSYLPGHSNMPVAFWCGVLVGIPMVNWFVWFEWRSLNHLTKYFEIVGLLALALVIVARRTWMASKEASRLRFEEEPEEVVMGLGLQGNQVASLRTTSATGVDV